MATSYTTLPDGTKVPLAGVTNPRTPIGQSPQYQLTAPAPFDVRPEWAGMEGGYTRPNTIAGNAEYFTWQPNSPFARDPLPQGTANPVRQAAREATKQGMIAARKQKELSRLASNTKKQAQFQTNSLRDLSNQYGVQYHPGGRNDKNPDAGWIGQATNSQLLENYNPADWANGAVPAGLEGIQLGRPGYDPTRTDYANEVGVARLPPGMAWNNPTAATDGSLNVRAPRQNPPGSQGGSGSSGFGGSPPGSHGGGGTSTQVGGQFGSQGMITQRVGAPQRASVGTGTYTEERLGDANQWQITPEQTVQGQINNIIAADSPLMQQARTAGLQQANARGLLNSGMAIGNAQGEVFRSALPIATSDADVNARAAGYNADEANKFRLTNQAAANQAAQFGSGNKFTASESALQRGFTASESALERELRASEGAAERGSRAALQDSQQIYQSEQNKADRDLQKAQDLFKANVEASLADIANTAGFDKQSQLIYGNLSQEVLRQITAINADVNMNQQSKDYAINQLMQTYKANISLLSAVGSVPDVSTLLNFEQPDEQPTTGINDPQYRAVWSQRVQDVLNGSLSMDQAMEWFNGQSEADKAWITEEFNRAKQQQTQQPPVQTKPDQSWVAAWNQRIALLRQGAIDINQWNQWMNSESDQGKQWVTTLFNGGSF